MLKLVVGVVATMTVVTPVHAQYGGSGQGSGSSYSTYGTGSNPSNNRVDGYYNNRGTYVEPHHRTNPNSTQYDNYNTRGNYNPYSGQTGTRTPRR